jgi:ABC-type branched-subunit amino acid transport system substrate-binding protein
MRSALLAEGLREIYPSMKRLALKKPQSRKAPIIVPRLLPLPPIITMIQGLTPDPSAGGLAYDEFEKAYVAEYGIDPGIYCSNSYDALAVVALAMEQAKNATGRAIADSIRDVSNPPGTEVSDLKEALELIREGKDIDYQGASGKIDFDEHGDVSGTYSVWSVAENGSIAFGGKVAV